MSMHHLERDAAPLSARVYRALLRSTYPRSFREAYGDQILQLFRDRMRDVQREGGAFGRLNLWQRTLGDLLASGVRVRCRVLRDAARNWRRGRKENGKGRRVGIQTLIQDIRYAARTLVKARGFTAVAVLTIALGVGANTAIFSVLNGIVLTPLPYREPSRLVRVWPQRVLSKESLVAFEQQMRSYSGLSGVTWETLTLSGGGEPEELWGARVSVNHFDLLGVAPALGRVFLPEEREPGRGNVVILSHGLWTRRFGADPGIIGQTVQLGGADAESRTVIGVLAAGSHTPWEACNAWLPLTIDPTNSSDYSGTASLVVFGRLAAGVSIEQAKVELQTIVARWQAEGQRWLSEDVAGSASVESMIDSLVGDVRTRIVVLLAAVGLVLLIACANVANLLLARGSVRQREIATRLAIGAARLRVVRQLLTEAILLGLLGGCVGLGIATWTLHVLKGSIPSSVPRVDLIAIDLPVLGFTVAVSLLVSMLFGLLPALRSTSCDLQVALHEGGRSVSGSRGRQRLHGALVVLETALAVILVAGAGVMLRSFWLLDRVDPGFQAAGMVTMRLSPPGSRYDDGQTRSDYYDRVTQQLESVPGVVSVGTNNMLPLTAGNIGVLYDVEDDVLPEGEHRPRANIRSISPGYFRTMGIPLVEGRVFDADDGTDESLVMILNETMARQLAPDGSAIGKRIGGFFGETFTVVGVVGDVHQHRLDARPRPEMYLPYRWWTTSNMYVIVRTTGDAARQIPLLQQAVWSVDGDVPISRVSIMDDVVARSLGDTRFLTQLLTGFAALALLLAAVGVYGVMSYTMSQRTHEIGVRMALGAAQGAVLRSALGHGVVLVAGGVVLGVAGAFGATRLLSSFLFNVSATDPVTYAAVGLFLIATAAVASFVPARRASRVDPIVALRLE